jgi:hypothetical protein
MSSRRLCNRAVTPLSRCYPPPNRTCGGVQHESDRDVQGRSPRRVACGLATLACGLAVAACGGSGTTAGQPAGSGTNASNPQALTASQCMRAHGITNFPDPVKSAGGVGLSVAASPGGSTVTVGSIPFSGPAFTAAAKTCSFGPGDNTRPSLSAAQRRGMLKNAACMRRHGVPNFPDPSFGPRGGVKGAAGAGVNPDTPAFIRSNQECNHVGVPLPGGG